MGWRSGLRLALLVCQCLYEIVTRIGGGGIGGVCHVRDTGLI